MELSLDEIKNLAEQTLKAFGKVNLLFNNAGVIPGTNILKNTIRDFQWVIGVNLWGVIYGVNTFLPTMFEQSEESHIKQKPQVNAWDFCLWFTTFF